MLKFVFWLLLLVNAGLLAFQQGYLDSLFPAAHEPTRMQNQLHADKLKLLTFAQVDALSAPASVTAPTTPAVPASAVTSTAGAAAPAAAPVAVACTEIGDFDAVDAGRFEAELAVLSLGSRLVRQVTPAPTRYMVFIPPQGSKEGADKKAAELKQLGVNDFFVIQDGSPQQWGISLGIFKTEDAARKHLAELNAKGVHSARVGPHGPDATRIAFRLHDLSAAEQATVQKVSRDFPRQQERGCS